MFSRVKVCVMVEGSPNEREGEERDRFWNEMDRTLDSIIWPLRVVLFMKIRGLF